MNETTLASASRILWRTLGANNVDPEEVFIAAGLDPRKLNESGARYAVEDMRKAWSIAAERINSPCFGALAGDHCLPGDLYGLGFVFLTSSTLKDALARIAQYNEVVDRVISFKLAETASIVSLSYENSRADLPDIPSLEVARWSTLIALCRRAKATQTSPLLLELVQKAPECLAIYQSFFQCDVKFGCARSIMHFRREDTEQLLPGENKALVKLNEDGLLSYIRSLHQNELSKKVATIISELLISGRLSKQSVADQAFMSTRTLQRKLAAEQSSYKLIWESVVKKYAQEYLRNPELSLSEISFLLGFSEQSAFSRACKAWFGKTPKQIRNAM